MTGEIRRIVEGAVGGYGVFGETFENLNIPQVVLALRGAVAANDAYYEYRPNTDTSTHTIVSMRWRWSINNFDVTAEKLKIYDNLLGIAQYGRCVMSAMEYRTDDVYISAIKQKSAVYSCVFPFDGEDPNMDLPCDEPQVEFPLDATLMAGFMGYSFDQFVSRYIPGTLQNFYTTKIADMAEFSPSPAVGNYQVGVTFVYRINGFTDEQWNLEAVPPRIIF